MKIFSRKIKSKTIPHGITSSFTIAGLNQQCDKDKIVIPDPSSEIFHTIEDYLEKFGNDGNPKD